MARIFQTVIRRIVSGATNTTVTQRIGVRLTTRLTALLATVRPGLRVSQGPSSLRIPARIGLRLSNTITGQTSVTVRPGMRLTNQITPGAVLQKPAVNITQVRYDLVSVKGSNSVTESAVGGRTDWQADADAAGTPDTVHAEFQGDILGARGGRLDLAYANYVNKTELAITKVELRFYVSVQGTLLNNADVRLQYNIGAGDVTLETITGDVASLTTPRLFDITTAIGGDWSKLDAITTHVRADAALGEQWGCSLDAVTVRVEANKTDTI